MELIANNKPLEMVQPENSITESNGAFIEANTEIVSLGHLREKCIIPVFSKDNETTLSHFQFIDRTAEIISKLFPQNKISKPDIRVSHVVKGRIPTAIGKPAKELLEHEKTIYYERCAFVMEIPEITQEVAGNRLKLTVGGVRAYNQENLYSKKSLEKFKVFIGFKNMVCTNLCISTDGFSNEIRIGSINDLEEQIYNLISSYDAKQHMLMLKKLENYSLSEEQFAHLIGKLRMFSHLAKEEKQSVFPITLNDSQVNNVIKDYYVCTNFSREDDGSISLWSLYNLFTEANKSSYIDSNFERNVNAHALIQELAFSMENGVPNWLLA